MGKVAKLIVFIPKETLENETRVSATPDTIKALIQCGVDVVVEKGAGNSSSISDDDFKKSGAEINEKFFHDADIIISVNPLTNPQINTIKESCVCVSFLDIFSTHEIISAAAEKRITYFSMNLIPRISRAQKMDALSSQTNIAGYKAVIMAANELPKIFPLMMTAAGTLHPAKVVVLGVGVAGLQAIATAKRLGAVVEASDVRPSVKEQVLSLGAKFIEVPFDKDSESKDGYANGASEKFLKKQAEEVSKRIAAADIVICTALVPGKKAPVLISKEMVKSMKSGSVIVDMAAVQGGNCELTETDKISTHHGVKIIGVTNIAATVPVHSTQMYSKNILEFLQCIISAGKLNIDLKDEIISAAIVTHDGKIKNEKALK